MILFSFLKIFFIFTIDLFLSTAVSARVSSASPKPMKINKSTPSPLPLQAETPIITQEQSSEVDSAKVSDAAADTVADSELIVLFDDILSRLTMSAVRCASNTIQA